MAEFFDAVWSLRTLFTLMVGVSLGLVISSLLSMSRRCEGCWEEIELRPVEEPHGDVVDIKDLMRRYE